jgi:opacity protein-like surface antigen
MKHLAAVAVVALIGLGVAQAADKPNPTGTWKFTVKMGNNTRDVTVKLKLDGDKLTGAMPGRNNQETAIEEGTFKDGEVSFKITRDRNGTKTVTTYTGKVDGDTIKGKIKRGDMEPTEWEAKRSKD